MAWQKDVREGARRYWPALAMVVFVAYFDYRLKGDAGFAIVGTAIAVIPFLFRRAIAPYLGNLPRSFARIVPARYRRLVLAGAPTAFLYLTRWKGTQSDEAALLSVALPLGMGVFIAANRDRIDSALAPFYSIRNAVLPKLLRVALALALPVVFAFAIAHGSLSDVSAFFGGTTEAEVTPGERTLPLLATVLLSTTAGFLLLNDPSKTRGRNN